MRSFVNLLIVCQFTFFSVLVQGQGSKADSLNKVLKRAKHDTTRISSLFGLGESFLLSQPDSALHFYNLACSISESVIASSKNQEVKHKAKKYWASSLNGKGVISRIHGDLKSALDYHEKGLSIAKVIDDRKGIATSLSCIGVVYRSQGDTDKALEFYSKALEIQEDVEDKKGMASSLSNIGIVYYFQNKYQLSLDYYNRSLKIQEEIKDKKTMGNTLRSMGVTYSKLNNSIMALECYEKSLSISEEVGDKRGLASSLINIGSIYDKKGNSTKALEYYKNSLAIAQEVGDKDTEATSLNNLANLYRAQGDIAKTLEYFVKTLEIREQINDKRGMALSYNNIGSIYRTQGDVTNALEFFKKSLSLCQEIDNKQGMAGALNNIGIIYRMQAQDLPDKNNQHQVDSLLNIALDYYRTSLKIRAEIGDKRGIALMHNNIGYILEIKNQLSQAIEYYKTSLTISEEVGDKRGSAFTLANIGNVYLKQNNIDKAFHYGNRAYNLSTLLGFPSNIERAAKILKEVSEKRGNYKKAFEYFSTEISMRDSITNEENYKETMRQQARYEYNKKAAIDSISHAKAIEIKELELNKIREEKQKQQVITYSLVAGFLIILIFSITVFRLFLHKREANKLLVKQKQQIELQNADLYQANEEISTQRDEILSQRDLVVSQKNQIERQSQQITDSINYAKRIQQAILPDISALIQNINKSRHTESLVFYRPKDIVSGDFYWANQINGSFVIALADCTGHGVPGAFMSMLGVSFLNETLSNSKNLIASEILNQLRSTVKITLNQTGKQFEARDGMSMALLIIDFENMKMQYSGSYIPLFQYRNNALTEYKPDRTPIGISYKEKEIFTNHTINIQQNDTFYLFTDGYIDQFSQVSKEKFKASRLKSLLNDLHVKPMAEQKDVLESTFDSWKGDQEQIDDATILGVRI